MVPSTRFVRCAVHPERIGRYEIRKLLGRGGQASVYLGYDTVMQREVAVKVLPAALAEDAQARERFEREARTIASLEHPAIVPVYDFGAFDEGLYIVMRLMKGGTLGDRLKQGPLNPQEISGILTNVASALDAAHQRGIVHRDIKPGNILFDEYGTAYLSDFGIARLNSAGASLTGSMIVGTPYYMSPEQISGDKALDGRSDVYALGALLYQMLTGHAPYEGETPAQAILKHLQEPVPRLDAYRPDLPPVYQKIIDRAMAKEREERYPTAGALAADFAAAVEGRPLADETTQQAMSAPTAVMPPAKQEGRAVAARPARRWWLWGMVLALLVAAGGGLAYAWQAGFLRVAPLPSPTPIPPTATPLVLVVSPSPTAPPTPAPSPTPTTPPSPTAPPSPTPLPSATPVPVFAGQPVGGADLIALVVRNALWLMYPDGSHLKQATLDGGEKRNLQWLSHDQLLYLSGKCVFVYSVAHDQARPLICFAGVETLDAFRVSPDGKQVAIVLDNELYIAPYDLARLNEARDPDALRRLPELCAHFSGDTVHEVLWSSDGSLLAARVTVPIDGRVGDQIEILRPVCSRHEVYRQHVFPGHRFPLTTYDRIPRIASFDWDGDKQFVFTLYWRNGGFGDMYFYSRSTYNGEQIQPVQTSHCCYASPRWSPDGSYLFFAFQDINDPQGRTRLYYIPAGTIGAGVPYQPLDLPPDLLTDPRQPPEAALRPAP